VSNYFNATGLTQLIKSDYAANCGDQPDDELFPGPGTLAEGDNPSYNWPDASEYTGVMFQRSTISLVTIPNGTSNTFMLGEKYLNPTDYTTGLDYSDNENPYIGFDNDNFRNTYSPPLQDTRGYQDGFRFGSAHSAGVNMVYCDGSVQLISYQVNPAVFKRAGNRN
jgi:prepilin-type processing-associated H-X9-DG protein